MKSLTLCFLIILFPRLSGAQSFSYKNFSNETNQDLRVQMGLESWNYYIKNNLDSLKIIASQLYPNKMVSDKDQLAYAAASRNLGSYFVRKDEIDRGIKLLQTGKKRFSILGLNVLVSETENELGNAFLLKADYNVAIKHYLSSMEIGQKTADEDASFNALIGFGKAVCASGDTTKGVHFVQQFLTKCLIRKKFESASDACSYLGIIAGDLGDIELMSAYYNRSQRYAKLSGSKTHEANALNNRAIVYYYEDQLDSTLVYFQEALELREIVGTASPLIESHYNLCLMNWENGDVNSAKDHIEEAEKLAFDANLPALQVDALELLKEILLEEGSSSEIEKIDIEIARIKELIETGHQLDQEIMEAILDYSNQQKSKTLNSSFPWWLVLASCALVVSSGMLFWSEKRS